MTVLATKLYAPVGRRGVVTRRRLTEQLDAVLEPGRKLALVSAPAGFGKTSLVSDWIAQCGHRLPALRTAWLSLDDGDNDLPRLLTHVIAAVRGIDGDIGSDAVTLPDVASASVEAVMTVLINEMAGMRGPVVLVLDDYHVLDAQSVHEAMLFLLDHLPPHVHLMITSRADPPLPLARLRARDKLVEVRAGDLRFTLRATNVDRLRGKGDASCARARRPCRSPFLADHVTGTAARVGAMTAQATSAGGGECEHCECASPMALVFSFTSPSATSSTRPTASSGNFRSSGRSAAARHGLSEPGPPAHPGGRAPAANLPHLTVDDKARRVERLG